MKPIYLSRTFWINMAAGILIVLEAQAGVLTALLPAHWAPWLLLGLPVANVVLRTLTTQAVSLK